MQRQLHSRRDLPPFWVTTAVQGPRLRARGENKVFAAFWRSLQHPWYMSGLCRRCKGRPGEQSKQWEGKVFAVVLMKDIFNVLSKTRGSEPVCAAEQRRSHRASKKTSAVRWQVQEYI